MIQLVSRWSLNGILGRPPRTFAGIGCLSPRLLRSSVIHLVSRYLIRTTPWKNPDTSQLGCQVDSGLLSSATWTGEIVFG